MGRQPPVGFRGRVGSIIFYQRKGQFFMRTAPTEVKQTQATKASASRFGLASRMGKAIRQQLGLTIPRPDDRKMQIRLVSAVLKWLRLAGSEPLNPEGRLEFISDFLFTEKNLFSKWPRPLELSIPADGRLEIKMRPFVPRTSIKAPADTIFIICTVTAAGADTRTGKETGTAAASFQFDYNNAELPEQVLSLELPMPTGSLTAVSLSLEYFLLLNPRKAKSHSGFPLGAGILRVIYIGHPEQKSPDRESAID